jgi:hypothetical protein
MWEKPECPDEFMEDSCQDYEGTSEWQGIKFNRKKTGRQHDYSSPIR